MLTYKAVSELMYEDYSEQVEELGVNSIEELELLLKRDIEKFASWYSWFVGENEAYEKTLLSIANGTITPSSEIEAEFLTVVASKEVKVAFVRNVVKLHGEFGVADVEWEFSPVIGTLGGATAYLNSVNYDNVEVELLFDGAELETYVEDYENLSTSVLSDICLMAFAWMNMDK